MKSRKKWIASLLAVLIVIQSFSIIDLKPLGVQNVFADTVMSPTQVRMSAPIPTDKATNAIPKTLAEAQSLAAESNLGRTSKTDTSGILQVDASKSSLSAFSNQSIAYDTTTSSSISIPTNVNMAPKATTLTVSWHAVAEAQSYEVSLDNGNGIPVTATNYTYNNLEPNTQHTVKVRAVNQVGSSEWSTEITKFTLLSAPINITATASVISVDLKWDAVIGATGYEIYRNGIILGVSSTNFYSDNELIAENNFVYTIKAYNDLGNVSGLSNPLTVTTKESISVATGKLATSDSQQNGNTASNANDGDTSTRWCANDENTGHWWQVDLGGKYNLTGTDVMWESSGIYQYKIETSVDGTTWVMAVDKQSNTTASQIMTDSFATIGVKYVKIKVTGLPNGKCASFYEFNVFGSNQEKVAAPIYNLEGGTYSTAKTVELSCTTAGAAIYYTIDGSEPTSSSPIYSSPINVSATTTIKAIAIKSGMTDSEYSQCKLYNI